MTEKLFFHGSPRSDLIIIRLGSYVTPDPYTAYVMGMNYNGRTWEDKDLERPYFFGTAWPKFRIWPKGSVTIYQFMLDDSQVEQEEDNPWEWRTKVEIDVRDWQPAGVGNE